MATISENLEALKSVKEDIKSAIEGKGQDLTNVPFTEYSNKINEITTKEDLDAELDEQEALLVDLRTKVNELPNKPDIDLSQTTATADDVFQGKQFYNAQGELVEGGYIDIMNRYIAARKSCSGLFADFQDEDMSWTKNLDTTGVTIMDNMFARCQNATSIDVSNFNTSEVTKANQMFSQCNKVTKLDVSKFDTRKMTNVSNMFFWCKALTEINVDNFDLSSATDIGGLFYGCEGLTTIDISKLDTQKATKTNALFAECSNLENIIGLEKLNITNSTTTRDMFRNCKKLTQLDLRTFDTSNVTTMLQMFYHCENLQSVNMNGCKTPKLTNMQDVFAGCKKLITIDLTGFDTSNVTNFPNTFGNCEELKNVIGVIDLLNATNLGSMLNYTKKLEDITLKNIKLSLAIGNGSYWGHSLTNGSIINTIQELWDNTDNALGGSRTLYLSTTSKENIANIYVKLIDVTDEMIANDPYITNKKPCVVCESTDEGAMTLTEYAIGKGWSIA